MSVTSAMSPLPIHLHEGWQFCTRKRSKGVTERVLKELTKDSYKLNYAQPGEPYINSNKISQND